MAPISNLAVVLCHGSYHTPAPYEPFIQALKAHGIGAYCPQRPSSDLNKLNVGDVNNPNFDRDSPEGGYPSDSEDVQVIVHLLERLINDDGKSVLLAGHSSGGWVAAQAALPALQANTRAAKSQSGGIIGIFFIGAFIIPVGESVNSFFQPKDGSFVTPPFMTFHKHGYDGLGTIVSAAKFLFNDLDEAAAKHWATTLTASPIMTTKLTNDAYSALPCAYLVLENDQTLPKDYQLGMATMQNQKGGIPFTLYSAPSGHSPHLSWTNGLVVKVDEFISSITA